MSTPKAKGDQARQLDLLHGVEGFSEAGPPREASDSTVILYEAENTESQGLKFIVLVSEDGTELLEIART